MLGLQTMRSRELHPGKFAELEHIINRGRLLRARMFPISGREGIGYPKAYTLRNPYVYAVFRR
jgi:hypothetical protein